MGIEMGQPRSLDRSRKACIKKKVVNRSRSRSRERAEVKAVKGGNSNMREIIDIQQFNGSWKLNEKLKAILEKKAPRAKTSPPSGFGGTLAKEKRDTAWATVLALWMLHSFYRDT